MSNRFASRAVPVRGAHRFTDTGPTPGPPGPRWRPSSRSRRCPAEMCEVGGRHPELLMGRSPKRLRPCGGAGRSGWRSRTRRLRRAARPASVSASRSGRRSTGRRVSTSTSTVPWIRPLRWAYSSTPTTRGVATGGSGSEVISLRRVFRLTCTPKASAIRAPARPASARPTETSVDRSRSVRRPNRRVSPGACSANVLREQEPSMQTNRRTLNDTTTSAASGNVCPVDHFT